MTMRYNYYL